MYVHIYHQELVCTYIPPRALLSLQKILLYWTTPLPIPSYHYLTTKIKFKVFRLPIVLIVNIIKKKVIQKYVYYRCFFNAYVQCLKSLIIFRWVCKKIFLPKIAMLQKTQIFAKFAPWGQKISYNLMAAYTLQCVSYKTLLKFHFSIKC